MLKRAAAAVAAAVAAVGVVGHAVAVVDVAAAEAAEPGAPAAGGIGAWGPRNARHPLAAGNWAWDAFTRAAAALAAAIAAATAESFLGGAEATADAPRRDAADSAVDCPPLVYVGAP